MDDKQRLQLNKMIKANDVENVTENIREKKHSMLIQKDINEMVRIKENFSHLDSNSEHLNIVLETKCAFLHEQYTDIFNRLKKDELNLDIMSKFLNVLKNIEDSEIDQHEGAYLIGKYLKEIYIDSALQRGKNLDEKFSNKEGKDDEPNTPRDITWAEFKKMKIKNK